MDGIVHVMRAFEDAEVIHVEDRVDPVEDIEIITQEVLFASHTTHTPTMCTARASVYHENIDVDRPDWSARLSAIKEL